LSHCCCWYEAFKAASLLLLLLLCIAAVASFVRAAVSATAQHCSYCPIWTAIITRRCYPRILLLLLLQLLVNSCHPSSTFFFWHCSKQCMEVVL
jgi:hypothetical protein